MLPESLKQVGFVLKLPTPSIRALKTLLFFYSNYMHIMGDRGGTVVKALCYKSEGRWFESRWCHWNFSLT